MSNRRTLWLSIVVVGALMIGVLTFHIPPTTPWCARSHVEINNVPEHTTLVYRESAIEPFGDVVEVTVPATRHETRVCDEVKR